MILNEFAVINRKRRNLNSWNIRQPLFTDSPQKLDVHTTCSFLANPTCLISDLNLRHIRICIQLLWKNCDP